MSSQTPHVCLLNFQNIILIIPNIIWMVDSKTPLSLRNKTPACTVARDFVWTTLVPQKRYGFYFNCFNPRPFSVFRHLRQWRGGGGVGTTPPWRSAHDGRRASQKKPVDASRRDLAIAYIVFNPRSTFDLVKSGQRSNFRENRHFLDLHAHSGKSMCRSDLKPSPACSPFNSEQYRV